MHRSIGYRIQELLSESLRHISFKSSFRTSSVDYFRNTSKISFGISSRGFEKFHQVFCKKSFHGIPQKFLHIFSQTPVRGNHPRITLEMLSANLSENQWLQILPEISPSIFSDKLPQTPLIFFFQAYLLKFHRRLLQKLLRDSSMNLSNHCFKKNCNELLSK